AGEVVADHGGRIPHVRRIPAEDRTGDPGRGPGAEALSPRRPRPNPAGWRRERPWVVIRRFPRRGRGFWFGLAIEVLAPLLAVTTRWRIEGGRHLPRRGGVLVASNHLSFADPLAVTLFTLAAGRVPRFFAKAELWDMPVVKWV